MTKFFSVLVTITFLLSACAGSPSVPRPGVTLDEITAKEIQRLLDNDRPSRALQWIYSLKSTRPSRLTDEELEEFEKEAILRIETVFQNAVTNKDFRTARAAYFSLKNISSLPKDFHYTADRLTFEEAEMHRTAGNKVLALNAFLQMKDYAFASDQDLDTYAELASELNNSNALADIKRLFELRSIPIPRKYSDELGKIYTPADYLAGTVTIWVNRGIKLERGIGFPDRVIGSGFYIDPRGYLLTNYHVIESEVDPTYEGYSRLFIKPSKSSEARIPAKVVGFDKIFDVALLKVEVSPSFVFGITNIQDLRAGTRVFALGSPGGLDNTVTSGIISATGRRFFQLGDAMQMDVPVNPGSSGGPLIDEKGRLIGIVFAGIEQFEGVNFAIPGYWIQKFIPELYRDGEVTHSWVGLSLFEENKELSVLYSVPGSPGYEVGIKIGDKIREINGIAVTTIRDAQDILLSLEPETLIPLKISRAEKDLTFYMAVEKRPYGPLEKPLQFDSKENLFPPLFGFSARTLSTGIFSDEFLVEKVYPGTVADETSISSNDPFSIKNWIVDNKKRIVLMQMIIKKRKAGFLEGGVQIGAAFEQNNFI